MQKSKISTVVDDDDDDSKTLGFALLPVGETEENFKNAEILENDQTRATESKKVQEFMDRYYKDVIENILLNFSTDPSALKKYVALYSKTGKTDEEKKEMSVMEASFRKEIAGKFKELPDFPKFFNGQMLKDVLPSFLENEEEKDILTLFKNCTTYFTGFFAVRQNMFSDKKKHSAIAYRCINENLPKFIDNSKVFEKISGLLSKEIGQLNDDFKNIYGYTAEDIFDINRSKMPLAQSEISMYNDYIHGFTKENGKKIKGLNECINLFVQQNKGFKLPLLKPLLKQILSDRTSLSFTGMSFENDGDVLSAINKFFNDPVCGAKILVEKITAIISNIDSYDTDGIYIANGPAITNLSQKVYGDWAAIQDKWKSAYDAAHLNKKRTESYYEAQNNAYKKISCFSISELQQLGIPEKIISTVVNDDNELAKNISAAYLAAEDLIARQYVYKKKLCKNRPAVQSIKTLLDSVKEFERFVKPFLCGEKEAQKDETFYGEIVPLFEELQNVDVLYNAVRNYVTKKPYSKKKTKLTFDRSQFLGGWVREDAYGGVILLKDDKYYLGILAKNNSYIFRDKPDVITNEECYKKMVYRQIPDAGKYFSLKNMNSMNPPENIRKSLENKNKKSLTRKQLTELIDYVMKDFIPNYPFLNDADGNCYYDLSGIKNADQYDSWSQFCADITKCASYVGFEDVSEAYIDQMVKEGRLYLFQIYNKDFSEFSHGKPNLHTLFFKMLFDERNLADPVYRLCGGAEMFYREASIKDDERIIHPKNQPVQNKNPLNPKKESLFTYDLIKDKRFTKPQFSLHLPVKIYLKADGGNINEIVRTNIANGSVKHVIGIDRGERNLIYVSVVNDKGKIVEQRSFNLIRSDKGYVVDYRDLLDRKEKERDAAKKSWDTINNIKELKEGYISQAVHEICKLVIKYHAIIALEDLNTGFINSRKKIDKQVYQKFENALINKLSFLTDKDVTDPYKPGGLLNAYQLTTAVDAKKKEASKKQKQNGIIFYVPAWLTSKIDPVTGFVDLLRPKYTSVEAAKEFIEKFDDIRFNAKDKMYEFDIDYSKFPRADSSYKKEWTICTNGERIKAFRNKEKNNIWDYEKITLTDEFRKLFDNYRIDLADNLKAQILEQTKKDFFADFISLLKLTLQMRNSAPKKGNSDNFYYYRYEDYIISPVRNDTGKFFDTRDYAPDSILPCDADANGAYNIARKALWAMRNIISAVASGDNKPKLSISNAEWLKFIAT